MDNSSLRCLSVGDANFGDAGVAALVPGVALSTSVQSLDLENKGLTTVGIASLVSELATDHALCSLRELVLSRNAALGDAGVALIAAALAQNKAPLTGLLGVQVLRLRAVGLTQCAVVPTFGLPLSPHIVELDLRDNDFSSTQPLAPSGTEEDARASSVFGRLMEAIASSAPALQKLQLANCRLVLVADVQGKIDQDSSLARAFRGCTALSFIDLSGNTLTNQAFSSDIEGDCPSNAHALSAALLGHACAAASNLEHLDVSGIALSNTDAPAGTGDLLGETTCGSIDPQNDAGISFVQALVGKACGCAHPPPAQLRVLDLSKNSLSPQAAHIALVELPQSCESLEELLLTQNGLGNAGATAIAAALSGELVVEPVQVADVPEGSSTDTQQEAFFRCSVGAIERLRLLDLANNGFTEPGAVKILEAVAHRCGVDLTLPKNDVSLEDAVGTEPALPGAPRCEKRSLQVLVLGGNTLGNRGHAAAEALEAALPGVQDEAHAASAVGPLEVYRGKLEEEDGAQL